MRFALPLLAVLALACVRASAADPGDAALRKEVGALEEKVRILEQRVELLEGRSTAVPAARPAAETPASSPAPATAATPAPAAAAPVASAAAPVPPAAAQAGGYVSPEAALRASWSKIRQGIDMREVERLLGDPSRKLTLDGRTVWYYEYPGTGRGSVFFTDAGRVSSSQSPLGWGW